ncbi:MAG: hypothetical protein ACOX3K_04165 [Bacilli bacterium]|jgi:hypothetical protein
MKKTISLILFSSLLTSCGIAEKDRIYLPFHYGVPALSNNYENQPITDYAVVIPLAHLPILEAGKEDFILYVGQDERYCSDCQFAGTAIREYIAKSKALIYYLDVTDYAIASQLAKHYEGVYEFLGTPTILFYQAGQIRYDHIGSSRLRSYLQVKNLIDGYTRKSSINYVFPPTNINSLFEEENYLFFLDYQKENASALFNSLKPVLSRREKFYFIDWNYLAFELQNELSTTYALDLAQGACLNYAVDGKRINLSFNGENSSSFITLFG